MVNPFDSNDTSFESGSPLSRATKTVVKQPAAQAKKIADDFAKAFRAQLYGPSTPGDQTHDNNTASHTPSSAQKSMAHNANPNVPLEEQAKMENLRRELAGNYTSQFKTAPNRAAVNITTDVEQEMEKARQERKQKEEQRKREEEEEERRTEEEKKAQQQELVSPAGKKTGVMFGKKQQQPIELERAQKRTESNRGTVG